MVQYFYHFGDIRKEGRNGHPQCDQPNFTTSKKDAILALATIQEGEAELTIRLCSFK